MGCSNSQAKFGEVPEVPWTQHLRRAAPRPSSARHLGDTSGVHKVPCKCVACIAVQQLQAAHTKQCFEALSQDPITNGYQAATCTGWVVLELREQRRREEVLRKVTEYYASEALPLPRGLRTASLYKLQKHWDSLNKDAQS